MHNGCRTALADAAPPATTRQPSCTPVHNPARSVRREGSHSLRGEAEGQTGPSHTDPSRYWPRAACRSRSRAQLAAIDKAAQPAEAVATEAPARGVKAMLAAGTAPSVEAPRHTTWTFGELPELMEIRRGAQTLVGFPAPLAHVIG